jgi:hypothetical protein
VSETGFRLAVALAALALIAGIASVRFGRTPGLPPRPASPPQETSADQLLTSSLASPAVWKNFLETDAKAAGVAVPTASQMARRFVYRSDTGRHELTFAAPTVAAAGLELTLERSENELAVLALANKTDSDLAYRVLSTPSAGASACNAASLLATNAMVIAKGGTERRTVCVFRSDLVVMITKIEGVEVPPLSAWYLQQVSPLAVGLEPRLAKAHRGDERPICTPNLPQSVRGGLQTGDLGWRDLVDFYARHRCETYQFPVMYRAFTRDNERPLPAVPEPAR